MSFASDFAWPKFICWARTALAAVALGLVYWKPPPDSTRLLYFGLGIFLAYAATLAIRSQWQSGTFGLLALFSDTVFFLILAGFGGETLLWVSSVFFLYLLAEALVFYGPVEVAVVGAVSAVFCVALPYAAIRHLGPPIVVGGALAFAFALGRQRFRAREKELSKALEETLTASEKAVEAERQRIASDFHDGPLQSFISLQMRLEIVRKLLDRDRNAGMEDLKQLQTLALTQIRDLRAFLHSMRPVDVDGANLMASARRTAESFQKESGIPVTFLGAHSPVGLPQEMSTEVLQVLKEALHNVQKHAGASRVAVSMEKTDRGLEIAIDDNGHGFNFAGTYNLEELELLRLGPASLKRRARSLNADLVLESRPGRGTGLKFRVPLQ
ncbi:MAG TPA: sensor histidine kinase [Bryobacteraceae bacterium]|nr:sensor histidine kinase [Bryobacteraceae bacterium]